MVASISMAAAWGMEVSFGRCLTFLAHPGQFYIPPFLQSCVCGQPLHPRQQICEDSIQVNYEFPWWITEITYPPEGVHQVLNMSAKWFKWVAKGALPRRGGDLETCKLSPANTEKVVAQLEEARQLLLSRIAHAEAKEAEITKQIATWENLVYKSATLDVVQHRVNHM